jgi:ketosteroid isomerase-like protein
MKAFMKMVLVLIVFGSVSVDTVRAQPPRPASQASSVADTIMQLEQSWTDAMIAADVPKVSQFMADDWIDGYPGKALTKSSFLESVKSGKHKLETCEFGPRDVKVLGDVAVLQGSVTETRITDGQSTTFRVAYMDVWVKRGDRWLVVRSHAKKI